MDFRRRDLPLDPFAQLEPNFGQGSWQVDTAFVATAAGARPKDVVVVIGEPTADVLSPILYSERLSASLLILVTSDRRDAAVLVPGGACPAVRILRLHSPLAPQGGGGARFVATLEWAERVARIWRAHGDAGKPVYERFEEDDELLVGIIGVEPAPTAQFTVSAMSSNGSLRGSWLTPPSLSGHPDFSPNSSPRSSIINMPYAGGGSSTSVGSARTSSPPSKLGAKKSRKPPALPPSDPTQRSFDVVFSFLPSSSAASPKSVLRHAVMVTTLSRPFLTVAARPFQGRPISGGSRSISGHSQGGERPGFERGSSRRWSLFTPSATARMSVIVPEAPKMPIAAHLVHVLAPADSTDGSAHAGLARALEAFVLSFADAGLAERETRAAPFVVDAQRLGEQVAHAGTVAELIMCGALDYRGKGGAGSMRALSRRAWVAGADDIALVQSGDLAPDADGLPLQRMFLPAQHAPQFEARKSLPQLPPKHLPSPPAPPPADLSVLQRAHSQPESVGRATAASTSSAPPLPSPPPRPPRSPARSNTMSSASPLTERLRTKSSPSVGPPSPPPSPPTPPPRPLALAPPLPRKPGLLTPPGSREGSSSQTSLELPAHALTQSEVQLGGAAKRKRRWWRVFR